eukprot:4615644-Amphidinium_carterae.1
MLSTRTACISSFICSLQLCQHSISANCTTSKPTFTGCTHYWNSRVSVFHAVHGSDSSTSNPSLASCTCLSTVLKVEVFASAAVRIICPGPSLS